MKIALGTAQMGLDYGISNKSGKICIDEATDIIATAKYNKIDVIDTAIGYGDSEEILGHIGVNEFRVITKLPSIPMRVSNPKKWVIAQVCQSLNRMKIDSLFGILLHDTKMLKRQDNAEIIEALYELKQNGLVKKIGVSIYNPDELETMINTVDLDLVQAPLNLVDRRLISSGWLNKLNEKGIEVHARSVFLQGLLLTPYADIPKKFGRWKHRWSFWHNRLSNENLDAVHECLRYVLSFEKLDRIVVGVQSSKQLEKVCQPIITASNVNDWSEMVCYDEDLINPSKWSSL